MGLGSGADDQFVLQDDGLLRCVGQRTHDGIGEKFPANWADVQRVAIKFRDNDPDGDGKANTFGMTLEAAKPRDLIHMLDLFTFGSGLRNTLVDPAGKVVIDDPAHARVLEEFLKTFTEYRYVAPDTINHCCA